MEGGVGRFRRTHLVPVPSAESYAGLNRMLLAACAEDDARHIDNRVQTIAEDWAVEEGKLKSLPAEPFPAAEVSTGRVDAKGRVSVRTNRYSVPIGLKGCRVEVRLHAYQVELIHGGAVVANHERLQGKHGQQLQLDHYLELLWHKPGALSRSLPLRQAREGGAWPEEYDRLWGLLKERYGDADGTRHLLDVLMMHRHRPADEVHQAVVLALEYGCYDSGAIAVLVRQQAAQEPTAAPLADLGTLARYERPMSTLGDYDQLLKALPTSEEIH